MRWRCTSSYPCGLAVLATSPLPLLRESRHVCSEEVVRRPPRDLRIMPCIRLSPLHQQRQELLCGRKANGSTRHEGCLWHANPLTRLLDTERTCASRIEHAPTRYIQLLAEACCLTSGSPLLGAGSNCRNVFPICSSTSMMAAIFPAAGEVHIDRLRDV